MRPLEEFDPVILPSGRRAVVHRRLEDGRVELILNDHRGRPDPQNMVALPEHLLRRIEPGRPLPAPVRIGGG